MSTVEVEEGGKHPAFAFLCLPPPSTGRLLLQPSQLLALALPKGQEEEGRWVAETVELLPPFASSLGKWAAMFAPRQGHLPLSLAVF